MNKTVIAAFILLSQAGYVEDEIERYKGPVLIIHGDKDETVPYFFGVKAAELYANAKLCTIEGADHCYNGHIEDLQNALRAYFN